MTYEKYLTIRDLQCILAIGRNTAYELINSGEIPCIRVGTKNLIRISPEDLENYIASHKQHIC